MKSFAAFLLEGGNIKVGDAQAAPFKVTANNRSSRINDIHDSMHELNKSFRAEHGHDLFHNGKAHYGGSSMQLMDKKIPDADFAKHKPTVGDVDVHVPHEHGDKLHAHLKTGAKFGKYTVAGVKKHGIDVSVVMKHDNGEHHQIDFIKGKHGRTEQSFLHSSHWDDVKNGVKGSHHKLLLNTAAGETHKFSISGGLKSRTDDTDKGLQHPKEISKALFGKAADHEKIHSFHGTAELIRDHIPASKHQDIYDRFKASTARAGDTDHTKALAHLKKTLNAKDGVNEELTEEADHHASVIPLVGFSPISHMGHAHDLGGALKKLPGKKHVGISQKADLYSPHERSEVMKKQWGQKDVNHHHTKSGGDTIGHAFHNLPKDGKKHLHILVGADRVGMAEGLKKSLEAGKIPEMNGHKWDSIHIHTPSDEGRSHGMSGTKMRAAAAAGDEKTFHKHLGSAFSADEARHHMTKIQSAILSKKLKINR